MRLARSFTLTEGLRLQAIGEVFNILNKTNFRGVNGGVGNASIEDLPAQLVGRRGPVTEAFSFAFSLRSAAIPVFATPQFLSAAAEAVPLRSARCVRVRAVVREDGDRPGDLHQGGRPIPVMPPAVRAEAATRRRAQSRPSARQGWSR